MNSRERIKRIIAGEKPDRCGFWLGMPHSESWPKYFDYFGTDDQEQVRLALQDDLRWISAEWGAYKHPEGKGLFDLVRVGIVSDSAGPAFANCEDPSEIDSYEWPNPDYFDFTEIVERLRNAGDFYRASGMWTCFFHIVAAMFGMEEYFIKMHTSPDVVDAVTNKVCEFYYEANERFYDVAGGEVDAYFFGNDLGTQLDLLVSPEQLERFVLPWTRKFVDQAHARGYQVMHHCCGAVSKVIPNFIAAGIDALHPLQALAQGMDAESLARQFKGKLAFIGAIDTQQLLVHGTPDQIKYEVRRVKSLLGPNLIVSPSHEALLPNVPPENVVAMAEAARE